ncbi:carbohydrate ABC transporter substrate-binding protein, CUT1 family [Halogeometricum borinquense DSM 11551]|uniref:Carbohydrate ABC transporter substrate-binding protein, CUT1 family n=2 Tax=Halogeometricum borinquense TaxID=60847 RepID=E4NUB1_HALBP|nr:ABC transporter substrate-binding protein [Halogeometricum borinquense]ADQ68631.1 carbohydrate ABC transporter substrate-binding protein, CUT1 family [Halogeometricum borinquense DSM 11551]ELY25496.1 carbohydrate ABC transporter substrate-binding protein, CUT1 family [Halogeometricum borinquense DSM 11551]RYJ14276.1 ABC transporter substrate-binding protein [Halogeometricum borinquense]
MTKHNTRRRFIKTVGATGIAGLAGCSQDGQAQDRNTGGDSGETSGTTAGSTGAKTTTIKFWHAMGGDLGAFIDTLASEFQQQADGIELEATKKGSYRETLNATTSAVQSGNPPAIAQIFEIGTQLAIDSGVFTPVEDIIPKDAVNFDDYLDSVLNYYRIDGKLHSMPFNSSNAIFYYNKNAFEEAGLDPENPPTSYEGVMDAAKTLTDAGVVDKGTTWPNHSWFVEQWFAEQNQTLVNNGNGRNGRATKANFESEASKNIFEWWTDLYNEGQYLNPGIEAWSEAQQAFLTQKTGMLGYSTSSIAPMAKGAKKNGFELGTMQLPTPNGKRQGVVIGGASLWTPASLSAEKKKAAGEFIAWLTKPEQQKRWHTNTGYFPVNKRAISQLEDEGFYEENPDFRTAIDQLRATKDSPATRGALMGTFTKVRTIVEEGYVSMIQDSSTNVEDALGSIDSQVEEVLKSYNQKVS